ncbi:MAG: excisionase [Bdellovibrionales bacterium CG22_combo_CG10-13_8_21_14_all_38_13]|nr:MAG: excisionase [Bdellovibrionales bacterium CG22_combo_CG10-13_8_21_14_all_38_13]PIR33349.1 MAG: excisionase [Alphaproteobacteria bacterium CG11_big_fil_rev_8_21_14_0_20_44_7]
MSISNNKLLTPMQVAEYLGVDSETLNVWRATQRYNLPYIKVGRLVRYKSEDVQTFIESRTQHFDTS